MSVLLAVAHGSRDELAQQLIRELLADAAAQRPGLRCAAAYLDNASPSVAGALDALVAEGISEVTVLPLLLGAATHAKTDLPGSVQAARLAHPRLLVRYGRPLGPHPLLVQALARRLHEAGADELPVLLVAGGSTDPDANAGVAATARLLWEGRGFPSVDLAFAGTTGPSVPQALARLQAQGCRTVALAPYFLGPGFLLRQALRQAAAVPGLALVEAAPLGTAPEVRALLLERYDEALRGDIRMNCDACLYRIAFPGREGQVGAAQQPHPHPDD